jgi:hypothetical protein
MSMSLPQPTLVQFAAHNNKPTWVNPTQVAFILQTTDRLTRIVFATQAQLEVVGKSEEVAAALNKALAP